MKIVVVVVVVIVDEDEEDGNDESIPLLIKLEEEIGSTNTSNSFLFASTFVIVK